MKLQGQLTPSFSFSIKTFFIATNFLLKFFSRALKTSLKLQKIQEIAKNTRKSYPKVPWPIFATFSYLDDSLQNGKSNSSMYFCLAARLRTVLDVPMAAEYPSRGGCDIFFGFSTI